MATDGWHIGEAPGAPGTRVMAFGPEVVVVRVDDWDAIGDSDAVDATTRAMADARPAAGGEPATRCVAVGLRSDAPGVVEARMVHPASVSMPMPFRVRGATSGPTGLALVVDASCAASPDLLWDRFDATMASLLEAAADEDAGDEGAVARRMGELGFAEVDDPASGFDGARH